MAFFVGTGVAFVILHFLPNDLPHDMSPVPSVTSPERELADVDTFDPPRFDPSVDYPTILGVKLLRAGSVHAEEMPYPSGEQWLGLFQKDDRYFLAPTTIKKTLSPDEELFNTKITTSSEDASVFLLKGDRDLKPGEVLTVFDREDTYDATIAPCDGSPTSLELNDRSWTLCIDNARDGYLAKGSKLILKDGTRSTLLRDLPEGCDDCSWTLIWSGDLDGDQQLDFFIDVTGHYNVYAPTLFLSSGDYKVFASFRGVGC